MRKPITLLLLLSFSFFPSVLLAQVVSFSMKTSPNTNFVFDTIDKYRNGIVLPSVLTLKVEAVNTEWDLYVGTSTSSAGFFDVNATYGSSGNSSVPVDILKARVFNTSNTSLTGTSFFNLSDINSPVYLIGSTADDPAVSCTGKGTNIAGSFVSQPQCYTFKVDLKATPGLDYRAGSYSLRVDFVLIQDL